MELQKTVKLNKTFIEVVSADGLARDNIEGQVLAEGDQIFHQILIKFCFVENFFPENDLFETTQHIIAILSFNHDARS